MLKNIEFQGSPYAWLVVLDDKAGHEQYSEAVIRKTDPKAVRAFSVKHNSYCLFTTKDLPEKLAA